MKNPFLIGERIYLRPVELEDAPLFQRWVNDQEITRMLSAVGAFPITRLGEEEWLRLHWRSETEITVAIVLRESDETIGTISLNGISWTHRQASLGVFIGEKGYWGKGFGGQAIRLLLAHAFGRLNLHRVFLHTDADNERAVRCYRRCGFVEEGRLRDNVFHDGKYFDSLVMSVLKEEFRI